MKDSELTAKDYQIFFLKSLFWLVLAWIGFAMALTGFFYASIAWAAAAAFGIWLTRQAVVNKVSFRLSREMLLAGILLLVVVAIFSAFSTPTVFSGRDQGSISEAAVRLAQNHAFEFSTPASDAFFKLHEPGRAQNFPGFYYTSQGKLITQFPLVYITWLALFYAPLGTIGFAVANALLLYIFLFSFYLLVRLMLKTASALPTIIFAATSFVFMWFSKFTLSENMALALVWLAILALMLFLKKQRWLHYIVFAGSTLLLFFTRIEGIALLATGMIIISFNKDAREFIKKRSGYAFFLPASVFFIAFILNTSIDINFYREIAKAMIPNITLPQAQYLGDLKNTTLPDFYWGKIFYLYGMLGFFILGAVGIVRSVWKKDFYRLTPLFFILPTFIYFFDSHITPDHPWMLRRFMFTLLPGAIFYSGLFLGGLIEKKSSDKKTFLARTASMAAILMLIGFNLPAFSKYLSFSENKTLFSQTKTLSERFSDEDLVLIDQKASGDGWSMISAPLNFLYAKNAVYFFNTQDLANLDTGKFEKIYLITPNQQVPYYQNSVIGEQLKYVDDYELTLSKIETDKDDPKKMVDLPEKKDTQVYGKIFLIEK